MTIEKQLTAIIGGTGLSNLKNLDNIQQKTVMTDYGEPSSPLSFGSLFHAGQNHSVIFLARHGLSHNIPPHKVNYRANISALKSVGVTQIIAVNAVGGIRDDMLPGHLVIPDQIIDYTTHRSNTFFATDLDHVTHIDFSYPYSERLSNLIVAAAKKQQINIIQGAVYGVTEGPRLETAAEIQRLKRDGCDVVGMTAMPEAALARELQIEYAAICVNANWGAGLSDELITMDIIEKNLTSGLDNVRCLLAGLLVSF